MAKFNIGDKVRIKERTGWPTPPGYRLAKAEGTVVQWIDYPEVMDDFNEYVFVHIEKAYGEGEVYIDNKIFFRAENLEKI